MNFTLFVAGTSQFTYVSWGMSQYNHIMQLMGTIAARQLAAESDRIDRITDAEFRVFSQFGEDGIIPYLVKKCDIAPNERKFVEFGVESYMESNTRFLLVNDNWSGLIMDPSQEYISSIKNDKIYWQHDLQAMCCFVGPDNLNTILKNTGYDKNIGIISIDIDGMDYWVWKSLSAAKPVIIICEYNSIFGPDVKVTVPYEEYFDRRKAHHSTLYFGASLSALVQLGLSKGYCFVGSNSSGSNAFFVRNDRIGDIPVLTGKQGYVESKFRQSRDEFGRLTYENNRNSLRLIGHMPVYDLDSNSVRSLHDTLSETL